MAYGWQEGQPRCPAIIEVSGDLVGVMEIHSFYKKEGLSAEAELAHQCDPKLAHLRPERKAIRGQCECPAADDGGPCDIHLITMPGGELAGGPVVGYANEHGGMNVPWEAPA